MRDLIESLGLSVPASFSATPDHLTLELEMMSFLLDAGKVQEAHEFLIERFAWLTIYRLKLVEAGREAVFFPRNRGRFIGRARMRFGMVRRFEELNGREKGERMTERTLSRRKLSRGQRGGRGGRRGQRLRELLELGRAQADGVA